MGTLRYADRAKKIQNKAVINESPQEKMIRELKDENDKLKKMLIAMQSGQPFNINELGMGNLSELAETFEENAKAMEEMEKPWEQKLQEEHDRDTNNHQSQKNVEDMSVPHLTNLNEDPQLTGKVYYSLMDCPVYVGRRNGNPTP